MSSPPLTLDGQLSDAVLRRDVERVRELAEAGAKCDQLLLCYAVREAPAEIIHLLIEKAGASADEPGPPMLQGAMPQGALIPNARKCQIPLHLAVQRGDVEVVRILLEAATALDARHPESGSTALMRAFRTYRPTAVKKMVPLFLARGADPNARDKCGRSVLECALIAWNQGGFVEPCVRLLIEGGADVNQVDSNNNPLIFTAVLWHTEGRAGIAKAMIEGGADVNAVDRKGDPLLLHALRRRNLDLARLLIDAGANVNATVSHGIHLAHALSLNPERAQLLKDSGADMDAKDENGRTLGERIAGIARMAKISAMIRTPSSNLIPPPSK